MIEKRIEIVRDMIEIHGSDGNWNANEYMLGLYNGLVLALAVIEDKDPILRTLDVGGYYSELEQELKYERDRQEQEDGMTRVQQELTEQYRFINNAIRKAEEVLGDEDKTS